ncbi:MAG: S8 family serine peptidase [Planctomycetota bacterium]|jgi:subtilisin family serine protease
MKRRTTSSAISITLFLLLSSLMIVDAAAVVIGGKEYQQVDGRWQVISATGDIFDVDPEVITVRFAPGVSEQAQADLISANGTRILRANRLGFIDLRVAPGADVIDVVTSFLGSELIESAEPNTFGAYLILPGDPHFEQQWHLNQASDADIDAPEAWDLETGSPHVVIAILDSGTDWTHDDMGRGPIGGGNYQNIWLNPGEDVWADQDNPNTGNGVDDDGNGYVDDWKGWDFSGNDNDARGVLAHGTFVSGIAGAKTHNGFGIAGVAGGFRGQGCGLMVCGIGNNFPVGAVLDDAILYAIDKGASVITMSLIVDETSAINAALQDAWDAGLLIDCASGNSGGPVTYPANNPNVIAVGATTPSDLIASFSSRGVDQEVAAPGVNILSCVFEDGFDTGSGTSFAAPIVAGIASLMFSINPVLTNVEARQILRDTAEKVGPYDYNWNPGMPGHSQELGYGRVNAGAAVLAARPSSGLPGGSGTPTVRPLVLMPNAPNPFNPTTQIRYSLAEQSHVTVSVHTPLGRHLRTLVDEIQPAGVHAVAWDGRDRLDRQVASGVYLYTVKTGDVTSAGKMLLAE